MTDSFHRSLDAALERSKRPPLALDDPYPIPFVIPMRFIAGVDPADVDPEFLKPINVLWQVPEPMTIATTGTEVTTARIAAEIGRHGLIGKSAPAHDDHDCRLITKPHNGCGCTRIVVGCEGCPDWIAEADGTQGDAFDLHVAAALSAGVIRDMQAAAWDEGKTAHARQQLDRGIDDDLLQLIYDGGLIPLCDRQPPTRGQE